MRIDRAELETFAARLMAAHGVDDEQSATVAHNLAWNDAAGRCNHGVERLPVMLRRVAAGVIACPCRIEERRIGPALLSVQGGDGFGQHVAARATERAIDLAMEHGLSAVGVSHSNFFGTGAYFANMAAERGLVFFVFSNSFPKVAAYGGISAVMGTNPLAFGAPAPDGRHLLVDMSTAGLAGSTIRAHQMAGTPLPEGLAIDSEGRPVTDPDLAAKGTLLPAAGAKGFGLALIVEILAGVLTGAGIGPGVASMYRDMDRPSQSGHFFIGLDPIRFLDRDRYAARFDELRTLVEGSGPAGMVRLPGSVRHDGLERSVGGVEVDARVWEALCQLAGSAGVAIPATAP